uniref:Uncharacterized protein n=1 Tax=Acrobeloides nanus TaxID=290746 RepID=A0A914EN62_9BILA
MATISDCREKVEVLYGESKEEYDAPCKVYINSQVVPSSSGVEDGKGKKKGLEALLWQAKEIEEIVRRTTDPKLIVSAQHKKYNYESENQVEDENDNSYLSIQRRPINECATGTWCVLVVTASPEVSDDHQVVQKCYWEHKIVSTTH